MHVTWFCHHSPVLIRPALPTSRGGGWALPATASWPCVGTDLTSGVPCVRIEAAQVTWQYVKHNKYLFFVLMLFLCKIKHPVLPESAFLFIFDTL